MTKREWRKPCITGCTCGKHRARKNVHPDGCTCAVHAPERRKACTREPGCSCGRHASPKCPPGCTCLRHRPQATEEQKAATRERAREWNRQYSRRRREADRSYLDRARETRQQDPDRHRSHYLKSKFGMTVEQWRAMRVEQGDACYLCGDALDSAHIHVDHSHACCPGKKSCGKCVRGLACRWCNQGIGQFRDDPARMIRAANALRAANLRVTLGARA